MTPQQTLAVAVRLFAILLALFVARELLWFFIDRPQSTDGYIVTIVVISTIIAIAIFSALWFFPKSIADGILPSVDSTPAKPSAPDVWLAVGSSLIGLWLIASSVPALLRNLIVMYAIRFEPLDRNGLISGLIYFSAQFAIGIVLILGARQIRNFISLVRTAGIDQRGQQRD